MILLFVPTKSPDYLCDTLFHGLKKVLGNRVIDVPRCDRAYTDGHVPEYGCGFTAWNMLGPEYDVGDEVRELAMRDGSSEAIVFQDSPDQAVRDLAMSMRHALVDGSDSPKLSCPTNRNSVLFKRECAGGLVHAAPIAFSFPAEKIRLIDEKGWKRELLCDMCPHDAYRYKKGEEQQYYDRYARFMFAETCKKGGWDCMRHYEIMAQRTIPVMLDEDMPILTCMSIRNCMVTHDAVSSSYYGDLVESAFFTFMTDCTTVAEASRFLARFMQ